MNPITREESLLDGQDLTPITRKEKFIKRIYDKTQEVPTPVTREEWFLNKAAEGSGGDVTIEQLSVTENGTYSEEGKAYSPVIVDVPEPTLITKTITENGTYNASEDNADGYSQVTVNVPYMEKKSASGDIASFSDGAGYPFLKVKANINPVQDLHGYDYPWVGGAGYNKWDEEWEVGKLDPANGIAITSNDNIRSKNYISILSDAVYYWCCTVNNVICFYDENKNFLSTLYINPNQSFTTPSNASYMKFYCASTYGATYKHDIAINYPSTVTTYAPYSNICPISGFTGVNVAVTGVNIWDEEWENGRINVTTGENIPNANAIRSKNYILISHSATYFFRIDPQAGSNIYVLEYGKDKNMLRYAGYFKNTIYTPSSDVYYIRFYLDVPTYNNDISINYPSTDTSYHAYNGHVYPISWQDEAGIVYGGYLDLVSGRLTVTMVGIAEYNGETLPSAWISDRDRYVAGNTPTIGAQVVYDLATPQTYQLTPQQINTLIGQNNVWNNTNGQTEVEYFIPIE